MKKIRLICFVLFCFVIKSKGQNLVTNPSFENHYDCVTPTLGNVSNWCSVSNNCIYYQPCSINPGFQAPLFYYDSCFNSYQQARSGVAYTSFYGYITTSTITANKYAHTKLKDTLKLGKRYCVTFYVNLLNYCQYSTDQFGALLTTTPFPCLPPATAPNYTLTGYVPQIVSPAGVQLDDTLNWMEVSGVYTALGNEAYLTIGDFFLQSQHSIVQTYPSNCNAVAEYYLDDVSVEEVQLAKCAKDTAICPNDSVLLGNNVSEATAYNWQPTNGLNCPTCANPKASPNTTTTYTLTKTQCKAVTTASITVTIKTDCKPKGAEALEVPNVFTPNGDGINDTFNFSIVGASNVSFIIYNRWGNIIKNSTLSTNTYILWDGHTTSGEACIESIYFYTLQYTDAKGDVQKKNGYVSLFR
jgi:gliding motility-associated-like protein